VASQVQNFKAPPQLAAAHSSDSLQNWEYYFGNRSNTARIWHGASNCRKIRIGYIKHIWVFISERFGI